MNKDVVSAVNVSGSDRSGASEVISELDDMYQGNMDHYKSVGQSALRCVRAALDLAGRDAAEIGSILDLPCGFGRVLRVLSVEYPAASITGCDLVREGVDFCAENFGSLPVYSDKDLSRVDLGGTFDLIWVGSLLTHVTEDAWKQFLSFFARSLNPNGVLVFTTQGRYSASLLRSRQSTYGLETDEKIDSLLDQYDATGFGFSNYFHSDDYGITLASPPYVLDRIMELDDLSMVMSLEMGWDNHQDVYAATRKQTG